MLQTVQRISASKITIVMDHHQEMLIDSGPDLSEVQGTPCRLQKRLFVPCSSSKRSLFREEREASAVRSNGSAAADADGDSDLGPMSPLALTDQSSCDSSPGRQFVSPLATPEKSPRIPLTNWSRMLMLSNSSPKRLSLAHDDQCENSSDEIVPETPSKEQDADEPVSQKVPGKQHHEHDGDEEAEEEDCYSERRLITPLGSLHKKSLTAPRLHRRKSASTSSLLEAASPPEQPASPEIKKCSNLKRQLEDSLPLNSANKLRKTEEGGAVPVPKARASLFKDEREVRKPSNVPSFTLAPKSFYGSSASSATEKKTRRSDFSAWREPRREAKRRRTLPSSSFTHSSQRRSAKKHRAGEINCSAWIGTKKPKPKPLPSKSAAQQKDSGLTKKSKDSKENFNPESKIIRSIIQRRSLEDKDRVGDPNKKFFKSKASCSNVMANDKTKASTSATASAKTNSNTLTSKSNQERSEPLSKKAKLDDKVLFDTTDLSVDEPDIEKSLKESNVNNILKVLEDDWADDDNDVMETAPSVPLSPKKRSIMLKNLTMSPGSELSNMTLSMNIKDVSASAENNISNADAVAQKKLYPLFSKNYSSKEPINKNDDNPRKRKRNTSAWQLSSKHGFSENQYQIDAGQKMFGATQCSECGIVYHLGDPEDENAHLNYHNSFKTLKFQGWKKEHVVYTDSFTSSRIILVDPKDSNLYWKKVNEILEIVDRDLGLSDTKLASYKDKLVYMYVRDKTILGVLVAEQVKSAFRIIPEISELNCCTSETSSVKCGINVVWTALSHRRQGIATKLVDTLRASFYYGYIMSTEDLAFSTPTPSGKLFAEKYTKTPNFKVY